MKNYCRQFDYDCLCLTQLLNVTKEDPLMPMRDQSMDFCYSDDDDDNNNDDDKHSLDTSNDVLKSNNNVNNTFFSPVGKMDAFSSHKLSPANADNILAHADIRVEAGRPHQVLACSDDADASPAGFGELRETATPDKVGSLRVPGLDGAPIDFNDDEEQHRLLMERILADQGEAAGILTRHRDGLAENEPTPRAWLNATPTPPPFVSPVRAQQMEDAMNSAIADVERTLIDFE